MPFRSMEQGIKAVQEGKLEEGARLLRIALRDEALSGKLRAVALTWLAETSTDPDHKTRCYKEALEADPGNTDVTQRMAYLLSSQLPPKQTPLPPQGFSMPAPTWRAASRIVIPSSTLPLLSRLAWNLSIFGPGRGEIAPSLRKVKEI